MSWADSTPRSYDLNRATSTYRETLFSSAVSALRRLTLGDGRKGIAGVSPEAALREIAKQAGFDVEVHVRGEIAPGLVTGL